MKKPISILISDIHYSITTLERADYSLDFAIKMANGAHVPLIICGDLHDTKAHLRAECVSRIINSIRKCDLLPYVLVGNHDLINEKSEENALSFIAADTVRISNPTLMYLGNHLVKFIPYQNSSQRFLEEAKDSSFIICHQGLYGAQMGHYLQDSSAIDIGELKGKRVISGHYHVRQTIKKGKTVWDYVGNPYTLGYGESNHPEKGIQVLYDDLSLEFIPIDLPRHQIIEQNIKDLKKIDTSDSILWVKITGDPADLKVTKQYIASKLGIIGDFKLDLIPDKQTVKSLDIVKQSPSETLDNIIDSLDAPANKKSRLKHLYKAL